MSDELKRCPDKTTCQNEYLIEEMRAEIERLRDDLETARKVAIEEIAHSNHLAAELEKVYANNQVCWEEPEESSPALIAHNKRIGK
jgi:hypothetical protein